MGRITHFQALSTALAATIGMGNIAGVAVAITRGGPGAIFWMWVAAFIGMNTKFCECTLAVLFRTKDADGQFRGGPMHYIEAGLPKQMRPLAWMFAICALIGTTCLFQVNQTVEVMESFVPISVAKHMAYAELKISSLAVTIGFLFAILIFWVLQGGIKRIVAWTSSLVPLMCVLYVFAALTVVFSDLGRVPEVLTLIVRSAFSGDAVVGGAAGAGILFVMRIGVQRAAFSNEAGMGTAPLAHGDAKTSEPVAEGLVAMFGPLLDTLIICTITAIVILTAFDPAHLPAEEITLTKMAFEHHFGVYGGHFLASAAILFAFTTMVGMANYNSKCWHYVFGISGIGQRNVFNIWYAFVIVIGAILSMDNVIAMIDIAFALMAIPNMIALLWLAPRIRAELGSYLKRYQL